MAQIACKYHNERAAKWYCESCQIFFCSSCIPNENKNLDSLCPVCHKKISAVAAENSIHSFWNRIPHFFLFPINPSTLIFLLVLSFTSLGIEFDPIFAISIPIIVMIFFLRYAYTALEQTAKGYMDMPVFSIDLLLNQLDLPIKQLLIIAATIAFNFTVYDMFGLGAVVFTMVFSIVATPASIMVLATEYSFFKAFNPLIIGKLITKIGTPYFILCAFLILLLISSEVSFSLLSKIIPENYIWPGYFFVNMYFVLIMYNMMGYVIFQYHENLGYDIEVDLNNHQATDETIGESDKHESIIQAEILLKEGKIDLAIEKLSAAINNSPADFSIRAMLHKILKVTAKKQELALHTSGYIERLLIENKQAKAIDILFETRQLLPTYLPDKANIRYELALLLNEQNYTDVALACVNNLHREFQNYAGIPKAYFLAAKIMCEKLGDDDKAITVINFVLNNYSGNELEPEMLSYIDMITNLTKED
jgi:tetratricopeptide (TPR) repeat protein